MSLSTIFLLGVKSKSLCNQLICKINVHYLKSANFHLGMVEQQAVERAVHTIIYVVHHDWSLGVHRVIIYDNTEISSLLLTSISNINILSISIVSCITWKTVHYSEHFLTIACVDNKKPSYSQPFAIYSVHIHFCYSNIVSLLECQSI